MRRVLSRTLLLVLVATCASIGRAPAQATKENEVQATVYYTDPVSKKEVNVIGIIQNESIAGLKMKIGKEVKTIPALDVRQITYKTKLNNLDYRKAFSTETNAQAAGLKTAKKLELYKDALSEFKGLLDGVKEVPQAYRYIGYKIAEVQIRIGQIDAAKLDDGIKALQGFRDEYGRGWETVPVLKLLAETYELQGNLTEASKVYEELADLPDAPEETKRTASMLVTQMLLRGKKFKEAETKLTALLARLPANDPQRGQITVLRCQSRMLQGNTDGVDKELHAALAGTTDLYLNSVGHNCLGDFYEKSKQPEEAFWEYLKVHLMYSQDRTEDARALYHLAKLFDTVQKDKNRAQECLDRLLNDKDYIGTEWQAKAKAEAKPMPTMP